MKKVLTIAALALFSLNSIEVSAQATADYGSGSGKVGYINQKTNPGEDILVPYGPRSFRFAGDKTLVIDSVGNKIITFTDSGKPADEVSFAAADTRILAEDIAFAPGGGFWIVNGYESCLQKVGPDGRIIDTFSSSEFLQPMKLEIDADGNFIVSDDAAQKILLFSPDQKFLGKIDYEWSGFALAKEKNTFFQVKFDHEKQKSFLVKQKFDGSVAESIMVNLSNHFNVTLHWVSEDDKEFLLTYKQGKEEMPGRFYCAIVDFAGNIKKSGIIAMPVAMNRMIVRNPSGQSFIGSVNYHDAPEGKFSIVPLNIP